jgi:23S rRNA (pseudouridine1915-N3)-methyltransferase
MKGGMRIRLVMVGRTERGFVADGLRHYVERIARTVPVEETVVAAAGAGDAAHQRRVEGERLLAVLRPGEHVVVLDECGQAMDSRAFADFLGRLRVGGVRSLAFVVGGAYGHGDAVRRAAHTVLSLSPMTMPHQLVRVVLAEQLHRALSILGGSGYHH